MLSRLFAPTVEVSAHCDLPCGVYDPAQARIEAESIKAIIAKVADNDDADFRTRAIMIKEERSELVKHHLWVLWTDYFKPPHFEKYPQLHTLVNEATKLAGARAPRASSTPGRPTSCWPRSTRSRRSSGRPRRRKHARMPVTCMTPGWLHLTRAEHAELVDLRIRQHRPVASSGWPTSGLAPDAKALIASTFLAGAQCGRLPSAGCADEFAGCSRVAVLSQGRPVAGPGA